jgi:protein gp37
MPTTIEWAEETLNPIRARRKDNGKVGWHCVRISPGCGDGSGGGCYAEKQNVQCGNNPGRNGTGLAYNVPSLSQVEIFLDEETLLKPLRWKTPRRIFWCSMTDWMGDFVPDEFRDKMLAVMALTPQHIHMTLTKRADRQLKYFTELRSEGDCAGEVRLIHDRPARFFPKEFKRLPLNNYATFKWPLPGLWLGVSVESPAYLKRFDDLLQTPAAVRWGSLEPLLDNLGDLSPWLRIDCTSRDDQTGSGIDWLVAGSESGPRARKAQDDWFRNIRNQCVAAKVPFFLKQICEHGHKIPTPELDGVKWTQYPEAE